MFYISANLAFGRREKNIWGYKKLQGGKKPIDMATFGEYTPSVVTRDSPCWISGTAPMI